MRSFLRTMPSAARSLNPAPRRTIYCARAAFPRVLPARAAMMGGAGRGLCAAAGKSKSFLLADIGEGIAEVEVLQWYVEEGATVGMFDKICEVQSDKATVDISSKYDGVITKLHYAVGDMAAVGAPLIEITVESDEEEEEAESAPSTPEPPAAAESAAAPAAPAAPAAAAAAAPTGKSKAIATPAVRRIALENNVDISQVPGSGKDGRVMKQDIMAFLAGDTIQPASAPPAAPAATPQAVAPVSFTSGETQTIPLRGFSRTMAKTMQASLQIPHLMYADEIEADRLIAFRERSKPVAMAKGIKLTYMPIMLKAASMALLDYPLVNSSINSELTEVTVHKSHNLGFAVATPTGLVVPNVKDCQHKSIWEIAAELDHLIELARSNSLGADTMTNTTFTLSNIGTIGGTYTAPIITPPQVAIGAIGKMQRLPRFDDNGEVVARNSFNISWSGDHRVIDGATIAQFGNSWKGYVEDPESMVLSLR